VAASSSGSGLGGTEDMRLFVKRDIALTPLRNVTGAHFVRLCGDHVLPAVGGALQPVAEISLRGLHRDHASG
jgi:hypothetical protein